MKKLYDLHNYKASKFLIIALVLAVVSIIFIVMTVQDVISSSKEPIDLNSMTLSQCKSGIHVTGDIYGTIGYYWESHITANGVKQKSLTERIYLIPFGTEGQYIGLNVHQSGFEKMDALKEATYKALDQKTVPDSLTGYEGYIKKCDSRMKDALKETYLSLGGSGDVNEVFVPYYIEQSNEISIVITLFGIGFFIASAVFLIIFFVKLKREKAEVGNSVYLGRIIFDRNDSLTQIQSEEYWRWGKGKLKTKDIGIYQICKLLRINGIIVGIIVIALWALLYIVFTHGNFVDMFYGVNRVYLPILIWGIGFVVINGFCLLIKLDKRQIQNQVAKQGINLEQFESNLDEGIALCQKVASDVFFISNQFGLLRTRRFWKVIRTEDIMKLGVDRVERGKITIERLHCLMKDGNIYTVSVPNETATQAAKYLKKTISAGVAGND